MDTQVNLEKNIHDLKQELISDLDQFLLEEKQEEQITEQTANSAREKALAELDKLISQDVSQQQILRQIQDFKQKTIQEIHHESINLANVKKSAHVLDLRPIQVDHKTVTRQPVQKIAALSQTNLHKHSLAKSGLNPNKSLAKTSQSTNFVTPKIKLPIINFSWPRLKISNLLSQAAVVAMVTAIVLLPIHGFYFLGKVKQDKAKIFSLSSSGLLSLQSGVLSAAENSYQSAQTDFEQALLDFRQAQAVLNNYQSWLLDLSGQLPIVGSSLSVGRNLLAVANNISEAATILGHEVGENAKITDYIVFASQQIQDTLPYLETASKDLERVSLSSLPVELQPYFAGLQKDLPTTIDNLKNLQEVFTLFSKLLGHEQEQRYLVLFQNNNELRASGGFIGSIAIVDVYKGKITNLEIPKGGTYDLTAGQKYKLKAPQALSLINPTFNIWDANWWPDFPKSASKVASFYEQADSNTIDGVIAINASVLQELLTIFGPIEMPKYGVTVTADNVFSVLQEQVEFKYDKVNNTPKAIIADLVPEVLGKLLSFTEKQKDIAALFAKLLEQKDIQIYSKDVALQKQISSLGWAGEILHNDRDYLLLVSTNIAGGKTDNDIVQNIEHQADIQANGEVINTIKITRTNQGPDYNPLAGLDGGNTSYLRLYVPLGSQFIEASGFDNLPAQYFHDLSQDYQTDPDISREENKMVDNNSHTEIYQSLDKTVLANWQTLLPGESKTVIIKYKLPFTLSLGNPLVNDWHQLLLRKQWQLDHYSLLAQSQSGSHNTTFTSHIILPANIKVVWKNASQADDLSLNQGLVNFSQNLSTDQYFGFILAR